MTTQMNLAQAARRLDAAGVEEFTSADLLTRAYPQATGAQQGGRIHAVNALVRKGQLIAFVSDADEAAMRADNDCPTAAIVMLLESTSVELADARGANLHYRLPDPEKDAQHAHD